MRPNGLLVPSADQYARQMVNAIGLTPTMAGYWAHEMFLAVSTLLPRWLVIGQTRKMMDGTRRRWEKKQQAKKDWANVPVYDLNNIFLYLSPYSLSHNTVVYFPKESVTYRWINLNNNLFWLNLSKTKINPTGVWSLIEVCKKPTFCGTNTRNYYSSIIPFLFFFFSFDWVEKNRRGILWDHLLNH